MLYTNSNFLKVVRLIRKEIVKKKKKDKEHNIYISFFMVDLEGQQESADCRSRENRELGSESTSCCVCGINSKKSYKNREQQCKYSQQLWPLLADSMGIWEKCNMGVRERPLPFLNNESTCKNQWWGSLWKTSPTTSRDFFTMFLFMKITRNHTGPIQTMNYITLSLAAITVTFIQMIINFNKKTIRKLEF